MTRGIFGFKKEGKYKVTYNNSDSYPSNLGIKIASFVQALNKEKLLDIFDKIIMVNRFSKSTIEERNLLSMNEYDYIVMSECLGDLHQYLNGMTYMADYSEWLYDQDYTYIINLDKEVLEVYRSKELIGTFQFTCALEEMVKTNY